MENREIVLSSVLLESPAHLRPVGTSHPTPLQPTQEPQHRTGRSTARAEPRVYSIRVCPPPHGWTAQRACFAACPRNPSRGKGDTVMTYRVYPDGIIEVIGYDK